MNKLFLTGRLTKDVEFTQASNDKNMLVGKFSLAVNDYKENVMFVNCVSFGKTSEFLTEYGKKGRKFSVIGRLDIEKYTNKEGKDLTYTKMIVEQLEFADSKPVEEDLQEEPKKYNKGYRK